MKDKNSILLVLVASTTLIASTVGATALIVSHNHDKDENNSEVTTVIEEGDLPYEQDIAQVQQIDLENHAENLNLDTTAELTEEEIEDLVFMREEEKLAHDVYTALYEIWGQQIFSNISDSEQRHTDSLKTLIDSYNLDDPFLASEGAFSNNIFTDLYNDLVAQGSTSIEDALSVGALIEDLDIVDLEKAMGRTENNAILTVYQNLQRGSRNHIRSFTSMLGRYGETYEPQYLSEEEYLEIISTGTERGSRDTNNNGIQNSGATGYKGGR